MSDTVPVALVTGAAGDIGRATSIRIADSGCIVALADRAEAAEGLAETRRLCLDAGADGRSAVFHFDVTDPEAVSAALDRVAESLGAPSMLFNNAGYQGHFANTVDYDGADLQRVLDVNVVGVFNVLQASARVMGPAGGGAIVNTASMAGVDGAPNMVAYSASKGAVIAMTKSAAKDLAPLGIRVNAVSPAFIGPGAMWKRQTQLQAEVPSQYYADDPAQVAQQMIEQVPLRRYGGLDEVASTVFFLLSAESSYITGFNVEVSGGV